MLISTINITTITLAITLALALAVPCLLCQVASSYYIIN